MTLYFLSVSLIILYLLLFRAFDFLSVGVLSFIIYTTPCLFGVANIPVFYEAAITEETYAVVNSILLFIFFIMIIYDNFTTRFSNLTDNSEPSLRVRISIILLSFFSIAALVYVILDLGIANLINNKGDINANINPLVYSFSLWSALVIFTYARFKNMTTLSIVSLLPIAVNFFIGSRAFAATCFVILLILAWHKSKHLIIQKYTSLFIGFITFLGILIYKEIYKAVKEFDFEKIWDVLSNFDTYLKIVTLPESQIVFAILNYVLETDYRLENIETTARLASLIPFVNDIYSDAGIQIRFSYIIKNYIFNAHYGLASNIWAEAYGMGSYLGIFILLVIWLCFLILSNKVLYKGTILTKIFILPISCQLAFYIHRLDIVQAIAVIKQMIIVFCVWLSLFFVSGALVKVINQNQKTN